MGALSGKIVLLVTHQVDFLPAFDRVLVSFSPGTLLFDIMRSFNFHNFESFLIYGSTYYLNLNLCLLAVYAGRRNFESCSLSSVTCLQQRIPELG